MGTKLTTGERIIRVETKITSIEKSLEEHKNEQRADFDKVLAKLDRLENSFAGKWTEKIIVGVVLALIGIIGTFII